MRIVVGPMRKRHTINSRACIVVMEERKYSSSVCTDSALAI
jgi:hypothetical protein